MSLSSQFARLVTFASFCSLLFASPLMATVLTFDEDPPVSNSENLSPDYGDRVTALVMPGNFHYGENGEGFTPNVVFSYDPVADADLWTTGYGDLVNVAFKEVDTAPALQVTFTADPGFRVRLHSWDMAAFSAVFSGDPTINSVRVLDSGGNELLLLTNVTISETTHTSFDYSANPFVDDVLVLEFNSGNLGNLSDDIALDNIVFSQVPEPSAMMLILLGIGGLLGWSRR